MHRDAQKNTENQTCQLWHTLRTLFNPFMTRWLLQNMRSVCTKTLNSTAPSLTGAPSTQHHRSRMVRRRCSNFFKSNMEDGLMDETRNAWCITHDECPPPGDSLSLGHSAAIATIVMKQSPSNVHSTFGEEPAAWQLLLICFESGAMFPSQFRPISVELFGYSEDAVPCCSSCRRSSCSSSSSLSSLPPISSSGWSAPLVGWPYTSTRLATTSPIGFRRAIVLFDHRLLSLRARTGDEGAVPFNYSSMCVCGGTARRTECCHAVPSCR
jgi:hypothetical protein